MGYPGKAKKIIQHPHHPWQKARIEEETGIVKKYGLRNKKSVWKFASMLRKYQGPGKDALRRHGHRATFGRLALRP